MPPDRTIPSNEEPKNSIRDSTAELQIINTRGADPLTNTKRRYPLKTR